MLNNRSGAGTSPSGADRRSVIDGDQQRRRTGVPPRGRCRRDVRSRTLRRCRSGRCRCSRSWWPAATACSIRPLVSTSPGRQVIVHRRSQDGGRTWRIVQLLEGDNGGATRPTIAAHGDDVAIGFIGSWCDPATPGVCSEAPYLATSISSGLQWTAPKRLADQAFDVKVAVDQGRVLGRLGAGRHRPTARHRRRRRNLLRVRSAERPISPARGRQRRTMVLALTALNGPRGPHRSDRSGRAG